MLHRKYTTRVLHGKELVLTSKGAHIPSTRTSVRQLKLLKLPTPFWKKDTDFVQNSEDYVKPEQINKDQHGCYPIYQRFSSLEEGTDYVVEEIKRLKEQTTCKLAEMVILHPRRDSLSIVQEMLNNHQIPNYVVTARGWNHETEEVKLCTMHSIKGLEGTCSLHFGSG